MASDDLTVPSHLSAKGRRLFASILERYELDPEGIATLTMAIEAHDLAATARRKLKDEGLIVDGPGGRPMAHPCVGIHRDCLASWRQLLGQLGIPAETDEPQTRNLRGHWQPKAGRNGRSS